MINTRCFWLDDILECPNPYFYWLWGAVLQMITRSFCGELSCNVDCRKYSSAAFVITQEYCLRIYEEFGTFAVPIPLALTN